MLRLAQSHTINEPKNCHWNPYSCLNRFSDCPHHCNIWVPSSSTSGEFRRVYTGQSKQLPVNPAPFSANWTKAMSRWKLCSHVNTILSPDVGTPPKVRVKAQSTTTLTQPCGFQGVACSWGMDKADARLSLRKDRPFFILNPVSPSVVPLRVFPCALVLTELWRQGTNMLVLWLQAYGSFEERSGRWQFKQGSLDTLP